MFITKKELIEKNTKKKYYNTVQTIHEWDINTKKFVAIQKDIQKYINEFTRQDYKELLKNGVLMNNDNATPTYGDISAIPNNISINKLTDTLDIIQDINQIDKKNKEKYEQIKNNNIVENVAVKNSTQYVNTKNQENEEIK